jgi:hypothetical protein
VATAPPALMMLLSIALLTLRLIDNLAAQLVHLPRQHRSNSHHQNKWYQKEVSQPRHRNNKCYDKNYRKYILLNKIPNRIHFLCFIATFYGQRYKKSA